jgi:hypothetical protein
MQAKRPNVGPPPPPTPPPQKKSSVNVEYHLVVCINHATLQTMHSAVQIEHNFSRYVLF